MSTKSKQQLKKEKSVKKPTARKTAQAKPVSAKQVKSADKPAVPESKPTPPPIAMVTLDSNADFVVLTKDLLDALKATGRTLARRTTLPVLGMWHIATDGNTRLKITTTTLEQSTVRYIQARVTNSAEMCLPGNLDELVSAWNDGDTLAFTYQPLNFSMRVQSPHAKANIKGMDANEFPVIAKTPNDIVLTLSRETLAEIVHCVTFAAASDQSRPILCGVSVTITRQENGVTHISYSAADGFRLSVLERDEQVKFSPKFKSQEYKVIVPANAFENALKSIPESKDALLEIHFGTETGQIHFVDDQGNALIASQIDGTFPDINRIIPDLTTSREIRFASAKELQAALRFASVLAKESMHSVYFSIDREHRQVSVMSNSAESGDNARQLALHADVQDDQLPDGTFDVVAYNVGYLIDMLAAFCYNTPSDDGVAFLVSSNVSPMAIVKYGGSTLTQVVMPMHINGRSKSDSQPAQESATQPQEEDGG